MDETMIQKLGRDDHKCRRSRLVCIVAWLPNTMTTKARVRSASGWIASGIGPGGQIAPPSPTAFATMAAVAARLSWNSPSAVVNDMPRKSPVIMMMRRHATAMPLQAIRQK